jgi:hypothetical protein
MKPPEVAQIHREICERENCEYLDKIDYADPCAFCPNGHFGRYELAGCDKEQLQGLCDAVAAVAQPIAKGIDAMFGTNIADCGGCKKRQTKLNKILPFK